MKAEKLMTAMVAVVVMANALVAQELRYSTSIQAASFDYYAQDEGEGAAVETSAGGCDQFATAAPSCGCDSGCCGSCCGWGNLGDAFTLSHEDACLTIGGWVQQGYSANEQPLSDTKGDLLSFNDSTGNVDLHQAWIYIGKEAQTDGCCWDWGFRFDGLYGTDAQKTQAFGNPGNPNGWDNDWDNGRYGWAIPQLYGEIAVGNLSVIAGHFFTIVGYEVIPGPDNFFFSHSFTKFNAEPFTHTGALATYTANDYITLYGGYTFGWNTGFRQYSNGGFGPTEDGNNFLGGFSITNCCETTTFTYIS